MRRQQLQVNHITEYAMHNKKRPLFISVFETDETGKWRLEVPPQVGGKPLDRGCLDQRGQRQIAACQRTYLRNNHEGQQGMSAKVEEIVVRRNRRKLEDLLPNCLQL